MQNTELKILPHTPTKKQVKAMYPKVNHDTLREDINEIMKAHRGEKFKKFDRILKRPEFEKVIQEYGYPKGYENAFR